MERDRRQMDFADLLDDMGEDEGAALAAEGDQVDEEDDQAPDDPHRVIAKIEASADALRSAAEQLRGMYPSS